MDFLGETHFLSLPRHDLLVSTARVPDTTTLAAHDFDVDTRTGFLPPQAPLSRLPSAWEEWEMTLDEAISSHLQLGDKIDLQQTEKEASERWRERVRKLPMLLVKDLTKSEVQLRRAHLVLAWILHFYIHSLPPSDPIRIPPPITIPLLQVSNHLQLPPLLTYSDDVLYNWHLESDDPDELPEISTMRSRTTFTSTDDEREFYLVSARIELAGVEALELMRSALDEMFVGDDIAVRRITGYLYRLMKVIHRLRELLLEVKRGCDPQVFFHEIRPWLMGEDSQTGRKWIFEGIEEDPTLLVPEELSGPSAGQSSLIHALDIFLGVDTSSHGEGVTMHDPEPTAPQHKYLLQRMQLYMPRYHRAFLTHLSKNTSQLRDLVLSASNGSLPGLEYAELNRRDTAALVEAYNAAVTSLKEFRDAHMIIVALYIIGPARHAQSSLSKVLVDTSISESNCMKGTGGTNLVRFLKGVRDQTREALIS